MCSRHAARGIAVALFAASLAACSSDTDRFNDNPFASRKPAAQHEATGSIASAPAGRVESRPLQSSRLPPPVSRPATVASPSGGVAGGGAGIYQPPRVAGEVTGTVRAAPKPQPQYDWNGGTPVTVARGETIESISLRYSVPASALMQANGLQPNSSLREGQRIVIPRKIAASHPAPVMSAPAVAAPATTRPAVASAGAVHVVAPGESLMGIARKYHKSVRQVADANRLRYDAPLRIGDRLTIPGTVASAPQQQHAPAPVASRFPPPMVQQSKPAAPQTASNDNHSKIHVASPAAEAEKEVTSSNGGAPQFRWPVRGRVISGFGPMTNGQQNDGVNLSVPEGTSIRAAEDGTVAYAGNELKGYGNLLLVRHANGYVTAYAHASELMVKRGDVVRRGQIIAKSGATGTVTSPQLHFEIRKGSLPVDPMTYLPGA
jgi:murein DD-endopeptidase MepM/ murein hydrolase activator NlpD